MLVAGQQTNTNNACINKRGRLWSGARVQTRNCAPALREFVYAPLKVSGRAEEWLLIEWPESEDKPAHYWLSALNRRVNFKSLVASAKGRWMIQRDYQELKSELGLSHYEGHK